MAKKAEVKPREVWVVERRLSSGMWEGLWPPHYDRDFAEMKLETEKRFSKVRIVRYVPEEPKR